MKRYLLILFALILIISGCTKVEKTRASGIDTIDNTNYFSSTYYYYGFTFSTAKLVATYPPPAPDITLFVNSDNIPSRLTFQASNLKPSFYKVGDYTNEAEAKAAFDNLLTVDVSQWEEMADPISDNQVWLYRSGAEKYAKVRIINTINEIRQNIAYGECTFQWVYQPDGSPTFPGK